MALSQEGTNDYLTFTCIYPPIEIGALKRGDEGKIIATGPTWSDWDTALGEIGNTAVVSFYKSELAQPKDKRPEDSLRNRQLFYRIGGKRRLIVNCRSKFAYIWQDGRFAEDQEFWRKLLSDPNSVTPVKNGRALRFYLYTTSDFENFAKAARVDLIQTEFSEPQDFEGPPVEE
jgi:hypothetical protein